ncbi:MAG: 23S rRNA (pseudouridine(1915)-N(3))-methyltransferase RlmH [Bdellovibrionales bacterium]|nr:23S rRNA (pseudouridine(1915)-N(3))-methyltransferase RlmH [Bdellovibrionales bacterium]
MTSVEVWRIQSSKEKWLELFEQDYLKKLNHFVKVDIKIIKTDNLPRQQSDQKVKNEEQKILKALKPEDYLIIFDEAEKESKNSIVFADKIQKALELNKQKIIFLIGGAFGLSQEVKSRANLKLSLSPLTMNHHVAYAMALEQLYRSFTIINDIPYHN